MIVPSCNNSNFFALNDLSVQLMEKFCACSEAKDVIASFTQYVPVEVEVSNTSRATTFRHHAKGLFGDLFLVRALIKIPEHPENSSRIHDLAFEVYNTEDKTSEALILAQNGELSMDLYAQKTELSEFKSTKRHVQLLQNCQNIWELDQSRINIFQNYHNLEEADVLNAQEIECHTDTYRIEWIKFEQKKYCIKHPEDSRSCQARLDQFCDYYKLHEKPREERKEIIMKRLCALFSKFSSNAKELYESNVKKFCPEKLESKKEL
jgi:uncharacterized protein YciW